jgi:hypothetical protein
VPSRLETQPEQEVPDYTGFFGSGQAELAYMVTADGKVSGTVMG